MGGVFDWNSATPGADGSYARRCSWCGKPFSSPRRDASTCGDTCRQAASRAASSWVSELTKSVMPRCTHCGEPFAPSAGASVQAFCSARCRVAHHRSEHDVALVTQPRRCAWCGQQWEWVGRGRPPRFCSTKHRVAHHRSVKRSTS